MKRVYPMIVQKCGRFCALVLCLCLLLCGLCHCKEESEDISTEATEYLKQGLSAFWVADCLSFARASAVIRERESGKAITGYLLYSESVHHNKGHLADRQTETYQAITIDPATVLPTEMTSLSTSYLTEGRIYYQFHGKDEKKYSLPFEEDYSSAMGLYSLSEASPVSRYGVKDGESVRVDLRFSPETCQKSQEIFIYNMQAALFGQTLPSEWSTLLLSMQMEGKERRITSYSLSFTGNCELGGESYTVSYRYEEFFTGYDAAPPIEFPDLTAFPVLKKE